MAQDYQISNISLTQLQGDAVTYFAMKAPSAANGGGFTVLAATAVEDTATGSGTSWSIALHKYSGAGTPALQGTIAAAIGGTASPWVQGVPKNFTISSTYAFIDAGEWIAIEKTESNSSDPMSGQVVIHWVPGREAS